MPIFELDEGDARLVQPMQPVTGLFAQESAALLDRHLAEVVGEALFPVRTRAGDEDGGPAAVALDGSGRPVVVEVAQVLDEAAVIAALRHAGQVSRWSVGDLARAFSADPHRFSSEYAAFRERVPWLARQDADRGVRVVLLCADVPADVEDTLAFLRSSGRDVRVLRLGVVHGAGDRRLVEVAPHVGPEERRRPVEPPLRLVPSPPGSAPRPLGTVGTYPPPVAVPTPPAGTPSPAAVTAPTAVVTPIAPGADAHRHAAAAPPTADATAPADADTPRPADSDTPRAAGQDDPRHTGAHATDAAPDAPGAPEGTADVPDAHPALAALGAGAGEAQELVWVRARRGQRLVVTLRVDGLLALPDGSVHADPDHAAARAADTEHVPDGWGSWRLGDGGPTLREATLPR
ncbi:hypothetical protein [Cellulomonas endophytica]|uniref:hypothetical protein n=1 Tax=Cellulomonas endophytica TaxID=2494735 RepID=UPI001010A869|nr:hypothetical protein [Cellulomonas endophytica]